MGASLMLTRRMVEADLPRILELESTRGPGAWTEGILRDELGAEHRTYLVAEDGEVVGFAGAMLVDDVAHVTNLLVAEESRGRGVGLRLMLDLIDAAVESGAKHLTLEVRSKNLPARALYAKLGLAPVGVRRLYYGDDDAMILWAHDLDIESNRKRLEALR